MSKTEGLRGSVVGALSGRSTGRDVVDTLGRLVRPQRERKTLRALDKKGALPAQRGKADWVQARPSGAAGGVDWPLVEQSFAQREYWPEGLLSSDGLFMLPALKKVVLTDASGTAGEVHFAQPPDEVAP